VFHSILIEMTLSGRLRPPARPGRCARCAPAAWRAPGTTAQMMQAARAGAWRRHPPDPRELLSRHQRAAWRHCATHSPAGRVILPSLGNRSGKTHLLRAAVREAGAAGVHAAPYVGARMQARTACRRTPGQEAVHGEGEDRGRRTRAHPGVERRTSCLRSARARCDVERLDIVALALFDAFNVLRAGNGRLFAAGTHPPAELPLRGPAHAPRSGLSLPPAPAQTTRKGRRAHLARAQRGLKLAPEIVAYVLTHAAATWARRSRSWTPWTAIRSGTRRPVDLPACCVKALRAVRKGMSLVSCDSVRY